ncbi:Uncharacterised protein [Mycobacteroides abscessus subsp. abscessus]|nr:Uncharacterised protein [Mycobacteroides abscessus subsp. abscessus]SLC78125.1 Uncharacterised protein [Mycobacteroides abscessus subsp. abscessus]
MREMWELPGLTLKQKAARGGLAIALVWALAAVPLVAWLALRDPVLPPPPAERELSVMELAAVADARSELSNGYVHVESQVTTAVARFEVTETVQAATSDSIGKVRSGVESADLLVATNLVYLRGNSSFWASIGVPTAFEGWVNVGALFGNIAFPLRTATAALTPGPQTRVENTAPGIAQTVYRSEKATAIFTAAGVISITINDRTAKINTGAADVSGPLSGARAEVAGAGRLIGSSGAWTVTEPAPPAPK